MIIELSFLVDIDRQSSDLVGFAFACEPTCTELVPIAEYEDIKNRVRSAGQIKGINPPVDVEKMTDAETKYKTACTAYERAARERDEATLAFSKAKRMLKSAEKALEAAKRTKEAAHEELKLSEAAKAVPSVKREVGSDGGGDILLVDPPVAQPAKKKAKTVVSEPKSKKKATKSSKSPGEFVELVDLILEKGMTPSKGGGRPCRDEREFLRFYAQFGKIEKKSRWKWSRDEDDFVKIERMLDLFKNGMRPPSNFRKVSQWKDDEWSKYELE